MIWNISLDGEQLAKIFFCLFLYALFLAQFLAHSRDLVNI